MKEKEDTFARLYKQNARDIYVYVVRSVGDELLAQDLMHDAFLNFFRIYAEKPLPDPVGCRMYLFRSARNLLINYGRTKYKKSVTLVDQYPETMMNDSSDSPESSLLKEEAYEEAEMILRELLSELDERSRTALLLRFQEDMRLEDIAKILDTSVATASRMISRSQKKLMQAGQKRGFHPEDLFGGKS